MKKIFQVKVANKNKDRQIDSIKNDVRKYIKREKSKKLPEGFNTWFFDCKFGNTQEDAQEISFNDIMKSIEIAASTDLDSFYLEILARPDIRKVKEVEAADEANTDGIIELED